MSSPYPDSQNLLSRQAFVKATSKPADSYKTKPVTGGPKPGSSDSDSDDNYRFSAMKKRSGS